MGLPMTSNSVPVSTKRILDQEALSNAALALGVQLKVFLAGPYIETSGKPPRIGEKNKAKRLRFNLFRRLTDHGWIVTLGEYKELINASAPILGSRNDAANSELIHAKKHANAIIMLPSSPGSFLELGAFSLYEDVCSKMIIIVDKKHEKDNANYFNTGPLTGARNKGALVHFIDYDDQISCWKEIDKFLESQASRVKERIYLSK